MFDFIQLLAQLRKYSVISTEHKNICYDDQHNKYIQIFLCNETKLDMAAFYKSYEQLEQYNASTDQPIRHLIFIYRFATIQIKKLKMYKEILCIEFFHENELRRLLVGNRFIPRHTKVSQDQYTEIIRKFGKDNLPTILNTDPITKLYNFDIHDIIEIERADAIYYRLVIPDE